MEDIGTLPTLSRSSIQLDLLLICDGVIIVTVTKFSPPKNSLFGILARSEFQNGNYEIVKNS